MTTARTGRNSGSSSPRRRSRAAGASLIGAGLLSLLPACSEQAPPPIPSGAASPSAAPVPNPDPAPAAPPAAAPTPAPAAPPSPAAAAPAPRPAAIDGELVAGPIRVNLPVGWSAEAASSPMRLLEMRVPATAAEGTPGTGECLVAFFSFGGDVASNIERWRGMVLGPDGKPSTAAPVTTTESGGLKVHTIEMAGTYMDGMPGGPRTPRENWMFRGAVIETPERLTFIRMTGPEAAMKAAAEGWGVLVRSIAPKP